MAIAMRIRSWEVAHENHRSKELKNLTWVPIPVKQDGSGYRRLIQHKDGAAHLGCWIAIVQIAAKCTPRGALIGSDGSPYDLSDISFMCGILQNLLESAVDRLLDKKIAWLEFYDIETGHVVNLPDIHNHMQNQPPTENLQNLQESPLKGREGKGRELMYAPSVGSADAPTKKPKLKTDPGFETFYGLYPKKKARKTAVKAWGKIKHTPELDAKIIASVKAQAASDDWTKDGGKYIPYPASWLNGEMWDDEMELAPVNREASFTPEQIEARRIQAWNLAGEWHEPYPDDWPSDAVRKNAFL